MKHKVTRRMVTCPMILCYHHYSFNYSENKMQDEIQKFAEQNVESYRTKITVKQKEKPVAFEPFDLNHTESFFQDWKSINRIMSFVSYVRNHHPALFEEAYQAALDGNR